MKHFAKLMLLTLRLVVVVAVVVSFLPRHASAQPPAPPAPPAPPNSLVTLFWQGFAPTTGCYVRVLPSGTPPSGCYTVPTGTFLVVTDILITCFTANVSESGGVPTTTPIPDIPCTYSLDTSPYVYTAFSVTNTYGFATVHDHFTTGIVLDYTPTPNPQSVPFSLPLSLPTLLQSPQYYVTLQGFGSPGPPTVPPLQ
ncbi:MAG: hypothetical protein WB347_15165 [Terriglobales bacterium]